LPAQIAPLIGRADNWPKFANLLRRPDVRLAILTAPGRRQDIARVSGGDHAVADFSDGAFIVDLADVVDPELVPSKIASVSV